LRKRKVVGWENWVKNKRMKTHGKAHKSYQKRSDRWELIDRPAARQKPICASEKGAFRFTV
jgi:hypothetical protein